MVVAVTSDLHGNLPEINKCDTLCICGDISPLHIQRDFYRMEYWMRSEFSDWINNLPCQHVIMVGGNHDYYLEAIKNNDIKKYESIYRPTKGKLEVLYNNECVISIDDNIYKIWGSPYCQIFGNWYFMQNEEGLKESYSKMPNNCDIVITHDAPKIKDYGKILEGWQKGVDCGNQILAKEIKIKKPKYHFFGHIHSGDHKLDKVKGYNTQFANVSFVNESYEPINNILYLNI